MMRRGVGVLSRLSTACERRVRAPRALPTLRNEGVFAPWSVGSPGPELVAGGWHGSVR